MQGRGTRDCPCLRLPRQGPAGRGPVAEILSAEEWCPIGPEGLGREVVRLLLQLSQSNRAALLRLPFVVRHEFPAGHALLPVMVSWEDFATGKLLNHLLFAEGPNRLPLASNRNQYFLPRCRWRIICLSLVDALNLLGRRFAACLNDGIFLKQQASY